MPNGYGAYSNMIAEDGITIQIIDWPGADEDRDLDSEVAIRLLRKLADQIEAQADDLRARGLLR
jgi:hypothetical protein